MKVPFEHEIPDDVQDGDLLEKDSVRVVMVESHEGGPKAPTVEVKWRYAMPHVEVERAQHGD